MREIFFSVIIPVYNAQNYLRQCIESIINQTYCNFELIIVDDGSTDNSGDICDEYKITDDRIQVYHNINSGVFGTRNFAISQAKGDYCIFVDADDYINPKALEIVNASINLYACDCLMYCIQRVNDSGEVLEKWDEQKVKEYNDTESLLHLFLIDHSYNSLCRKAIATTILKKAIDEADTSISHGEDRIISLKAMLHSNKVVIIPDILYNYRYNIDSITNNDDVIPFITDFVKVENYIHEWLSDQNINIDSMKYELYASYLSIFLDVVRNASVHHNSAYKKRVYDTVNYSSLYVKCISYGHYGVKKLGGKAVILFLFKHKLYSCIRLLQYSYSLIKNI